MSIISIYSSEGKAKRNFVLFNLVLVGLAVISRVFLLANEAVPFNADEAIVALMGRHILAGNRIPVYFYGQAYMGSLDAIFVALGFGVLGEQVWVIRFIQLLLYIGFLGTAVWLVYSLSKSLVITTISCALLSFPTVNVYLYTTVSLGGYGEALLIGNLILIVTYLICHGQNKNQRGYLWLILGFLMGFGFWVFGLTLVFSLASILYLLFLYVQPLGNRNSEPLSLRPGFFLLGLSIGLIPILGSIASTGIQPIFDEAMGSAIAGAAQGTFIEQIGMRLFSFIVLGIPAIIGIRPPWEVRWLLLPLLPGILFFWIAAKASFADRSRGLRNHLGDRGWLLLFVILINVAGFLLTPFGSDPSGRYFLPMTVPLAVIGALFIVYLGSKWRHWLWILPVMICVYNLGGVFQTIIRQPPGLTTQIDEVAQIDHRHLPELIDFLTQNKIEAGYTNYWVAYPMAFLSQEELIFIPSLPYHLDFRFTSRDNRYPTYNQIVAEAENIAYITTNHEPLNKYLREQFQNLGLEYSETKIGNYQIFYGFPRNVRPEEIGLGKNR